MSINAMEEELFSHISEVVRTDYPGCLVTHWTAVVTVVQEDGTELIITLDRPGQAMWQSMGMIDFVREMRRALISHQMHDGEPED